MAIELEIFGEASKELDGDGRRRGPARRRDQLKAELNKRWSCSAVLLINGEWLVAGKNAVTVKEGKAQVKLHSEGTRGLADRRRITTRRGSSPTLTRSTWER